MFRALEDEWLSGVFERQPDRVEIEEVPRRPGQQNVADNRSPTDSGIGLVLAQMTALRSHHPDACSANATRHGTPMRFFAGSRDPLRSSGGRPVAASWPAVSLNVGWARFGPPV